MRALTPKDCPGSYRKPDASAGSPDEGRGTCPVCGESMVLGYALLLPAHPSART